MGSHGTKYQIHRDYLNELYNTQDMSMKDIANIYGCSIALISKKIKQFNIKQETKLKYIGETFGLLHVISYAGQNKHNRAIYRCRCECGTIKDIDSSCLTNNRTGTRSCGCNAHPVKMKCYEEIPLVYFKRVKNGAVSRNLEFSISIEQCWNIFISQNRKCALSDIDIEFKKTCVDKQTASLDRIDSSIGYTVDNIQWVHKDINQMKMDLSEEYFFELCGKITNKRKINVTI